MTIREKYLSRPQLEVEYNKLVDENERLKKQNKLLKIQNEMFHKDIKAARSCFKTIKQKELCIQMLYEKYEKEHSEKCRLQTELMLLDPTKR